MVRREKGEERREKREERGQATEERREFRSKLCNYPNTLNVLASNCATIPLNQIHQTIYKL